MVNNDQIELNRPLVVLFSDYNQLVKEIADVLLNKGYEVIITTSDVHNWNRHEKQEYKIVKPDFLWTDIANKVVNLGVFIFDEEHLRDYYNSALILAQKSRAKTLIISSFTKNYKFFDLFNERVSGLQTNEEIFAGVLYLAEIFERSSVYKLIINSSKNNQITIDPRDNFFLISRETAEKEIIKGMFSLSVYGKSIAVTSLPISSKTIFKTIVKFNPQLIVNYKKSETRKNHKTFEKVIVDFDLEDKVGDLVSKGEVVVGPKFEWKGVPEIKTYKKQTKVTDDAQEIDEPVPTTHKKTTNTHTSEKNNYNFRMRFYESVKSNWKLSNKKSKVKKIIYYILLFLLLPITIFLISLITNKTADLMLTSSRSSIALNTYKISKSSAFISQEYSRYMSYIPILGIPYKKSASYSSLLYKDSNVSLNSLETLIKISDLLARSLSKDTREVDLDTEYTNLDLDGVYNDYGLIKAEVINSDGLDQSIKTSIIGHVPTDKELNRVFYYKQLLEKLPNILGKDEPREYAVLLVDNRIKRPGGGVIEAVGITSFDKGNLINIDLYDTAELDSQLKGFVNPPTALEFESKIEAFYLRDALWNPDFPASAEQVQWFLKNQINKTVDGVIMLDMNTLSMLLRLSGPISIDGQQVIGDNLLTALKVGSNDALNDDEYFKELLNITLNRITKMSSGEIRNVLSSMVQQTLNKHVVIYLNELGDDVDQTVLSGAVEELECNFENCINDFVSVSEMEKSRGVGVNKQAELTISLEEGLLKRELVIYFKNQSGLAEDSDYLSNLLVSIPQATSFSPVTVSTNEVEESVDPELLGYQDIKQAVFSTEIGPGEVKAYSISWESGYQVDFSEEGQFRLKVIKQPGEEPYSFDIVIKLAGENSIFNNKFDLTNEGTLHYNTQLSEDLDLIFNW